MTVHIGQDHCIATITIDRERKLTALDYPTIHALLAALDRSKSDAGVCAIALTGAGSRVFSAGADIPSLAVCTEGGTKRALRQIVRRGREPTRRIGEFPKPVIVAGPAGMREDDRAQPPLLLHIACQAGSQILAGPPARYLCGAPVSLLLTRITPGDGPDGPGVCPICAALDHLGNTRCGCGRGDAE